MEPKTKTEIQVTRYTPKTMIENGENIEKLIKILHPIAEASFQRELPFEAINDRVRENDLVMLVTDKQSGQGIGYVGLDNVTLAETQATYICSVLLNPSIQTKGLGLKLCTEGINEIGNENLIVRTQNPHMYGLFKTICEQSDLKLAPNGSIPNSALELIKAYDSEIDENLIRKGIYFGRSLMPNTPEPNCDESKKIWKNLDVNNGDATYLVGLKQN